MDKRICPICQKTYKDTQSVKRHVKEKHPHVEDPVIEPSPKKLCPFCSALFTDLAKHVKRCPKKPKILKKRQTDTNKEWLQNFKNYMSRPGACLSISTIKSYMGKIKRIIAFEVKENSAFKASNWMDPSAQEFQLLRPCEFYIPGHYQDASVAQV